MLHKRNRSHQTLHATSVPSPRTQTWTVNVAFTTAVACAGTACFGYHLGVMNGCLEQVMFELGVGGQWSTMAILEGLVVSTHLAGTVLGILLGSSVSDWMGRRNTLLVAAQAMILAPLASMHAPMFEHWNGPTHQYDGRPLRAVIMMVSRFLVGTASGVTSAVAPTYIREVSAATSWGFNSSLPQLAIGVGIVVSFIANAIIPAAHWRAMLFIGELPAIFLALGMLVCPESPSWLETKARHSDAGVAARWLWGHGASELTAAQDYKDMDRQSPSPSDKFSYPSWHRPRGLIAACGIATKTVCQLFPFQPITSFHPLIYFSTMVFRQVGADWHHQTTVLLGLVYLLGTAMASNAEQRMGRRFMVTACCLSQTVAWSAIYFSVASNDSNEMIVSAASLFCALSFGLGAVPVTFISSPELNPCYTTGLAHRLSIASHCIYSVMVGQVFLLMLHMWGLSTVCVLWGGGSLLGALFAWIQIQAERMKRCN